MRVYTYYHPISLYSEDSQRRLIDIWARSWSKQGWEPIVLNEGDAMPLPWYQDFKNHVSKLPTEYGNEYEYTCFARWAAMAAQESEGGGGLLTDYDVINYSFRPPPPEERGDCMILFTEVETNPADMGVVYGSKRCWTAMCNIFHHWQPHPKHDWNPTAKCMHCSDLSMLVRMLGHKTFPAPTWLRSVPGVQGHYSRESGKTFPVVHYGYEMKHHGCWPKCDWIEAIRPF